MCVDTTFPFNNVIQYLPWNFWFSLVLPLPSWSDGACHLSSFESVLLLVPPRPKPDGGGAAPIPFGLDDEELALRSDDCDDTAERMAARVPPPALPPPPCPRGGPIGLLRFGGGGAISADDLADSFLCTTIGGGGIAVEALGTVRGGGGIIVAPVLGRLGGGAIMAGGGIDDIPLLPGGGGIIALSGFAFVFGFGLSASRPTKDDALSTTSLSFTTRRSFSIPDNSSSIFPSDFIIFW